MVHRVDGVGQREQPREPLEDGRQLVRGHDEPAQQQLREQGAVEVGYGLAESARGRGLATEALRAMVGRASALGVATVVAMTAVDNLASQRVLERLGFTRLDIVVEDPDDGPLIRWELALEA